MLELYGPEPEGGYPEWQKFARDFLEDYAAPREEIEAYCWRYDEIETEVRRKLFPDSVGREMSDFEHDQIFEVMERLCPQPDWPLRPPAE